MLARSIPKTVGIAVILSIVCHRERSRLDTERLNKGERFKAAFPPYLPAVSFCDGSDTPKWSFKWKPDVVVGDAEENYKLACEYRELENGTKWLKFLQLAADQGHGQAQFELGIFFYNNKLMQEAVKYFQLAADQGYVGGQFGMGMCYERGDGIKRNIDEADRYMTLAADQEYPDALVYLGNKHTEKMGADRKGKDAKLAAEYFIRAADQGHPHALTAAGYHLDRGIGVEVDHARAAAYNRKAADQGSPLAQCLLALMCIDGRGVKRNMREGARLLRLSADQGFLEAQYILADYYHKGSFGKDRAEQNAQALHYFKLAADQGHRLSALNVGVRYLNEQNFDEALHYLYFASRNGELAAEAWIGHCHVVGAGVKPDAEEGLRLIQEAADKGCIVACQMLADLYTKGAPGVLPSAELAQKYNEKLVLLEMKDEHTSAKNLWTLYKW